jgi:hypothetical protein
MKPPTRPPQTAAALAAPGADPLPDRCPTRRLTNPVLRTEVRSWAWSAGARRRSDASKVEVWTCGNRPMLSETWMSAGPAAARARASGGCR